MGEDRIVLKPFLETTTFRNVVANRTAVVNLTDDAMLLAPTWFSRPSSSPRPSAPGYTALPAGR